MTRTRRPWLALGALSLSLFMIMLDSTAVNVALPAIEHDLAIGLVPLEWTVTAYTLSFAVLLLPSGKLADFVGRRRVYLAGLVVFTGASLACGLAGAVQTLIAARAVQGAGAALMLPATLSLVSAAFAPRERGRAIGAWAGISLLALGVGPLAGGLLVEHLSWGWIFYVNVPIGAVGLAAGRLLVPESRDGSAEQSLDLAGIAASATGLFALTFAVTEGNELGWRSPAIGIAFAAAALFLGLFVALESRRRLPMLDLSLFRNATFAGANLVALTCLLALFGVFFFLSIFIQAMLGYSAVETGAVFLPMTIALVVATPVAGKLADRVGSRLPMTAGMVLVSASMLAVSRAGANATLWDLVPPLVVGGVGFGLTTTPSTVAVLGAVPPEQAGVASGVVTTFRQVGGALGIAVMGAILAFSVHGVAQEDPRFGAAFVAGYEHALLAGGAIALVGAAIAWLTVRPQPAEPIAKIASRSVPVSGAVASAITASGRLPVHETET